MKKALGLLLALSLLLGAALPAGAVSAETQLTQVTQTVKATLGIGDGYDSFYGEPMDNGVDTVWSLNWSNDEGSLMVEADSEGKVLSYFLSVPGAGGSSSLPSFPNTSRDQAQAIARDFLAKVLDKDTETASFAAQDNRAANTDQHRFSGTILLNDLPSPLTFSVTVRAEDGAVIRFHRDDLNTQYTGGLPSAAPQAGSAAAGQALKETLSLRLEYVLDEGADTAVLRYLPNPIDDYYVDAGTGDLVNLTQLFEDLGGGLLGNDASGGAAPEAGAGDQAADALSKAEQEGIARLEGVQSKEKLDQAVRAVGGLGLKGYALSAANYQIDRDTDQVFARLRYVKEGGWSRTVTVDARSGALYALYGSAPYDEDRAAKLTQEAAQEKAEAFLSALWGEEFALTACYEAQSRIPSGAYSFTFAQQANGYFFPGNAIYIQVDSQDGSVCGLNKSFDRSVSFDAPDGLISEEAALDAWFATYDATLGYLSVPVALDPDSPAAKPLLDRGLRYFYRMALAYYLERESYCAGIDAKTGAPVSLRQEADMGMVYSDLEGHWAQVQIEALAGYGIGYYGGQFQPDRQLTQLDLLALLASAQGYRYQPEEEDAADQLYRWAYDTGLLTAQQRRDGAVMTRGETVQLLLDSAGYGEVARLEGIFRCSFSDEGSIPDAYYGYAAIAQGMGIVGGDKAGAFAAGRSITRAEAAVMLYNFMNR